MGSPKIIILLSRFSRVRLYASTEIGPLDGTHTIGQNSGFRGEHVLCVRKIERHIEVLRP